jgi:hypothetical protein
MEDYCDAWTRIPESVESRRDCCLVRDLFDE